MTSKDRKLILSRRSEKQTNPISVSRQTYWKPSEAYFISLNVLLPNIVQLLYWKVIKQRKNTSRIFLYFENF